MITDRPDVRLTGEETHVLEVERTLGDDTITKLAFAARKHNVMISVTISPYADEDEDGS